MSTDQATDLAQYIARLAVKTKRTVAVAESLTGGAICAQLAAAPDAADWFRGGIVAYAADVKFDVLGVQPGAVITQRCAISMAEGAARLLDADIAVAATGVGGPDPVEGQASGTVCLAATTKDGVTLSAEHHFDGAPEVVVASAVRSALDLLTRCLEHAQRCA